MQIYGKQQYQLHNIWQLMIQDNIVLQVTCAAATKKWYEKFQDNLFCSSLKSIIFNEMKN